MWYIIYPRGDRAKIDIVEVSDQDKGYDLGDYAVASRREFDDDSDAIIYAKQLAKDNAKLYVGPGSSNDNDNDYLD